MKILHTADWHIGQLFHEYDRTYEHQQFLNWLLGTLTNEHIDVLLISGDVFDLSNPSAASIKMFYSFLNQVVKANSNLQIIITAGNHDSAARLESPKPLLESSSIHIVGFIEKDENGMIDYSKITIPLKDKEGHTKAWCIAAPFLRMGDYPLITDGDNPYSEGVAAFYKGAYEYAASEKEVGQVIVTMGHLHAQHAEVGDIDKMERLIMGGVECISASAFHEDICYVALGHIHKAQRIGGKEHIRYCGSPLPMSFSEANYRHQVIVFNVVEEKIENLNAIEIPVSVPLMRVPAVHSSFAEVIASLEQLTPFEGSLHTAPYLEARVLLDGPEPGLRHKVETALTGKNVRLAKIDVRYQTASTAQSENTTVNQAQLNELQPLDVLHKVYQSKYNNSIPKDLLKLFQQVTQEVSETEE
ncbi:exonuclease SbcCD subunit D C-terminal domain-containing protein [Chitinophaga sp. GbtcB8]|uniref:exonuclease SbcCD subunit D C-terminal domain-containing protein n=1 Tax=Chitinophaga sp. GbtcB8 TaxID=2824753 RepID=UPI001C2FF43A|nr:exonuclease SbcCD subunit D C-terminal domain-containing protein [Chitinophaga sp. GbtcB8]